MAKKTVSSVELGEKLIKIGLAIQLVFFGFFVVVASIFHFRARKAGYGARNSSNGNGARGWESLLWSLYIVSALILVRSVFRLVEYGGGSQGYLISHEAFLYIFDACLMCIVPVVMALIHPSEVLGSKVNRDSGYAMA
jgi:RTA1 like protein